MTLRWPRAPRPESPRILIVDDNPKIHDDFRKILAPRAAAPALETAEAALFGKRPVSTEPCAFDLYSASQGELAVEQVRAARDARMPFSVAFVDIRMPPGWDGIETARTLWSVDPELQIVLCTAYSDYTWDDMARELGTLDGFLILKKPFDAIEVRQIAHALSHKWQITRDKEAALQSLEQQVARRTAELERAIAQLRAEMADRLKLEKDLRHAQKLEALGRLMAGIGHEINNPLSYVLSNLEYCQAELRASGELPPERASALADVLEEATMGAERIRKIVNAAREFSRPWEEPVHAVDIEESFASAIRIVGNQLRHRARLVQSFTPVPHVLADPHRLEQVFINVLMNAVEALDGKHVTHEVRVSTRQVDDNVLVEISDTGRGIAEADLERIFDPFFSTRPVGQGTGLGLWICRNIIESFGGRIEYESQVGRGTTARILLRAAAPKETTVQTTRRPSRGPEPTAVRARVLVIDDEPGVLRALSRVLAAHEVTTTSDAQQAVELYKAGKFDIVFCDLMMPGFSGVDFYHELAQLGPEHASRIVMMTGGVFTESIRQFLNQVKNPCIAKPFERGLLQRLIERQLEERPPSERPDATAPGEPACAAN